MKPAGLLVKQSSFIFGKCLIQPGNGRTADDKNQVRPCRTPVIPESLESRKKVGSAGIQPGHLIKEDNLLFKRIKLFQVSPQMVECLRPVFWRLPFFPGFTDQFCCKTAQLNVFRLVIDTGNLKREFPVETFVNQEGLSDSSSPTDYDQLRLSAVQTRLQTFTFVRSADDIVSRVWLNSPPQLWPFGKASLSEAWI